MAVPTQEQAQDHAGYGRRDVADGKADEAGNDVLPQRAVSD